LYSNYNNVNADKGLERATRREYNNEKYIRRIYNIYNYNTIFR